jgi:hypothetical protein
MIVIGRPRYDVFNHEITYMAIGPSPQIRLGLRSDGTRLNVSSSFIAGVDHAI